MHSNDPTNKKKPSNLWQHINISTPSQYNYTETRHLSILSPKTGENRFAALTPHPSYTLAFSLQRKLPHSPPLSTHIHLTTQTRMIFSEPERGGAPNLQLLPRVLRPHQLLHVPRGADSTARLAADVQGNKKSITI